MKKIVFLFALSFSILSSLSAQSLRINEVSNGTTGSEEYVELVVIGTPLTSCNQTPTCLDLRGWIVDDNNGYFSGGPTSGNGIATGAIRFANTSFWECVNPGTIILIYNDADMGSNLPPNDNSSTDQNCKLVIPISSTLFERHDSQPSIGNSQYATTGWVAGGNWNNIGLANSADAMQIYAPTNTTVPVHGISYGSNLNTNAIIYFAGAGGGLVFSCLNTTSDDFSLQANWASASATTNETPGTFNSTQNETYVSSLNLNCSTPLTITPTNTDESCNASCDGSISIVISGGVTPYNTSSWSNGSTGNQLSNLCQGIYTVTVTDAGGCSATETIQIQSGTGINLTTSGNITICEGESTQISANGPGTLTWNQGLGTGNQFTVSPSQTTTYTVSANSGGCQATQNIVVTVQANPTLTVSSDETICSGESVSLQATSNGTVAWNQGLGQGNNFQVTPNQSTNYTATATLNGCTTSDVVSISVNPIPIINAGSDVAICVGQQVTLTATGATSYSWNNNVINGIPFSPTSTANFTVTGTDANGCTNTDQVLVTVNQIPTVNAGTDLSVCSGENITLTASGTATNYSWSGGVQNGIAFTPTNSTTYTVTGTSNGCSATDQVEVTITSISVFAGNDTLICEGQNYTLQASGAQNYVWSNGQNNGTNVNLNAGIVNLTVVGNSGTCFDSDDLILTVISCDWELEMPNVITPNGDLINDFFEPVAVSNVTINGWKLVNRWGNTLIESSNPIILWKPESTINDDVLFYRVFFTTPEGKKDEKQGFVTVKKD